jgi:hypothetical protein
MLACTTATLWLQAPIFPPVTCSQSNGVRELTTATLSSIYCQFMGKVTDCVIQMLNIALLIRNLISFNVERFLNTKHSYLRQAVSRVNNTAVPAEEDRAGITDTKRPSKVELWNERRRARHEQVQTLHRQGASI